MILERAERWPGKEDNHNAGRIKGVADTLQSAARL